MNTKARKFGKALFLGMVFCIYGNFLISNAVKAHFDNVQSDESSAQESVIVESVGEESCFDEYSFNENSIDSKFLTETSEESDEFVSFDFDESEEIEEDEDYEDIEEFEELEDSEDYEVYENYDDFDELESFEDLENSEDYEDLEDCNDYDTCEDNDDYEDLENFDDYEDYNDFDDNEYLSRTDYQQFMFEAVMYCEGGAQGTSRDIQVANAWLARNKIEQAIEKGSDDPFFDALNPNHYQGVFYDEYDGWRVICPEGTVTQELIDSNPSIHEVCEKVLNGEISSPIYNWDCTQCFDYFGFDDGVAFAEEVGITQYIIIENGIYFPSSEWTDKLTWYCMNY